MGSLVGHVIPGVAFFLFGLWHLFNHIKMYATNPLTYKSTPWFPTSKFRRLELYLLICSNIIYITIELFVGPSRHQPLDLDGTIPTYHLHTFEHASVSLSFLTYAVLALILDKSKLIKYSASSVGDQSGMTQFIGAVAFGQEFLLFHLHSTDHAGVEWQYHMFLQLIILVSLFTTLMGIGLPNSFLVGFVRSVSIVFQGVWFIVMGIMLWTPSVIPKGCHIHSHDGHKMVKCHEEGALYRATALVNIQFSWYVTGITIVAVYFYKVLMEFYGHKVDHEYTSLTTTNKEFFDQEAQDQGTRIVVHLQKKNNKFGDSNLGKSDSYSPLLIEK